MYIFIALKILEMPPALIFSYLLKIHAHSEDYLAMSVFFLHVCLRKNLIQCYLLQNKTVFHETCDLICDLSEHHSQNYIFVLY